MTKTNVPRLRFREFNGEWKDEKFKSLVERVKMTSDSDQYKKIEFSNIDEGKLINKLSINDTKGIAFRKNDILFGKLRPYLKNWYYSMFDGVAVGDFWVFRAKSQISSSMFIYYLIQTHRYTRISNYTTGTKMPRSDWNFVSNSSFYISNLEEQQKIGSFFAKIDKLIELQTKKLKQLKKLKQGYLQKMFPQDGESVPRLRFSGFSEEWKVSKGKAIFYNFSDKNHEDLPPLSVTQDQKIWYRDELDPALSYDKQKLSTYKLIDKNDVVIGLRSFVGGFAISDKRGIVSPAYTILKFRNTPWDFYFTRNLFTSYVFIQSLKKITYGIRVNGRSISYNDFSTLPLVYTDNLEEQKKIGSLLNTVDSLIELQEKKLDNIKKMKKAYLQKMFI